jgi:hypothetical protein
MKVPACIYGKSNPVLEKYWEISSLALLSGGKAYMLI